MILGAKILTATTQIEVLIGAFGRILKPIEKLGIPVVDFFFTMGLTIKSLPIIKDKIIETYREKVRNEEIKGFSDRARVVSNFLLPVFLKSLQSPEKFFEEYSGHEKEG